MDDDARTWSWWQGASPVECTEQHDAITVTVAELDDQFGYTVSDDDPEQVDLSVADRSRIGQLCDGGVVGVTTGLRRGSRIETVWYLPRPEQWDAGARWLRCDITVRALGPLNEVTLEALPPTALEVIAAADEHRVCMDTAFPAEDYGPWLRPGANTLVPCDEPSQWEWVAEAALPDGPLPDREQIDRVVRESCVPYIEYAADRTGGWSYWPGAQGWENGARTVRCWMR